MTRTLHFGTPTDEQKRHYTLVLKGHVDVARLVFLRTAKDTRLDVIARAALFSDGLDYLHGTGHGIGSMLGVHESKRLHLICIFRSVYYWINWNY